MITVSKDNTGDYTSIQEAVDAISSSTVSETIFIKNGTYNERVEITHNNITLIGESMDNVIITKDYYALMTMPDNTKRGTFRSYTFFVHANNFHAYNITFVNSSGFGTEVGQAIAVYAEGDNITFKNCKLLGHQDTLFTGPLPLKEKQPGGFTGPTEFAPRILSRQLYEDCFISGEIDFIFGSATAYFKNCTLYALNRNKEINSYYTAPSTYECQKYGYVFEIDSKGCGLIVDYHCTDWYNNENLYINKALVYNSVSLFKLIDNLEYITFNFSGSSYTITREHCPLNKNIEQKINDNEFISEMMKLFETN